MNAVVLLTLTYLATGQSPTPKLTPSQATLQENRYPSWFRDGKLGIWAHWGPQSVPMMGDWYARNLYNEGSGQYNDHLARYGHPSKFGHKDLIPLWRAEKWDPARLMKLYKKAGAKYFVSMGVHHDNFDLWNSTHNRWNAVKMGPHRDVVGDWQRAAKKEGLRFGVSEHLGASYTWFQVSRGADKTGPMAGVPYDGNDPAYEDLYHPKTRPGDTGWYTNDPRFHADWSRRITDLVDQYHPDLLYTDGGIPFGRAGEDLVAHLYQDNKLRNGGRQQVVYACKQPSGGKWVQDVERGVLPGIEANPWQIDTSIGDWFYNKNWKYRGADWVIHTLVDVVSKNGNLLINVVQRPDGSLDPEAEVVLADMAEWMKTNGESIYNTRPWVTFGEGPTRAKGGAFREDFGFSAKDIRFTAKGVGTVYATLMGKPQPGEVILRSFAKNDGAKIRSVRFLGGKKDLKWSWQADGLHVSVEDGQYSPLANVLKISGSHLRSFEIPKPEPVVASPDSAGNFELLAGVATIEGTGLRSETSNDIDNLGYWDNPTEYATWNVYIPAPGTYDVTALISSETGTSELEIATEGSSVKANTPNTGSWASYQEVTFGTLKFSRSGVVKLSARPASPTTWHPLNLRKITLKRRP